MLRALKAQNQINSVFTSVTLYMCEYYFIDLITCVFDEIDGEIGIWDILINQKLALP